MRGKFASSRPRRAILWHLAAILGPSWGHLGVILGPSGGHLGSMLGPSWGHQGPPWGSKGRKRCEKTRKADSGKCARRRGEITVFTVSGGELGGCFRGWKSSPVPFGWSLGAIGRKFASSGPLRAILWHSDAILEPSRGHLKGQLGAILKPSEVHVGAILWPSGANLTARKGGKGAERQEKAIQQNVHGVEAKSPFLGFRGADLEDVFGT